MATPAFVPLGTSRGCAPAFCCSPLNIRSRSSRPCFAHDPRTFPNLAFVDTVLANGELKTRSVPAVLRAIRGANVVPFQCARAHPRDLVMCAGRTQLDSAPSRDTKSSPSDAAQVRAPLDPTAFSIGSISTSYLLRTIVIKWTQAAMNVVNALLLQRLSLMSHPCRCQSLACCCHRCHCHAVAAATSMACRCHVAVMLLPCIRHVAISAFAILLATFDQHRTKCDPSWPMRTKFGRIRDRQNLAHIDQV